MRLGRIASIVIVATGVAAPAPGPAGDAARVLLDRGGAHDARGIAHLAKADSGAARTRAPGLAAPGAVAASFAAAAAVPPPVAPPPAPLLPAKPNAALRQSVEEHPVERQVVEKRRVAIAAGKAAVQLGAFASEAGALAAWAKIAAASEGALGGLRPAAEPVDVPAKGRLWRLKTTVFDKAAARNLCQALVQRKLACVPAKG